MIFFPITNINCLEIILLEKEDDLIPLMPKEIAENLLKIKEQYRAWIISQQDLYAKIWLEAVMIKPNDKKTFAITVQQHNPIFSGAFFALFDNKYLNMKDFVAQSRREGSWPNSFLDKILASL